MNLSTEMAAALLRAGFVGALAVLAGAPVGALLATTTSRRQALAWALALVPYLTPVLLVGYAYGNCVASLIHYPRWNYTLYLFLLCLKLTPVAALVLFFAPRSLSAEAWHCHRLTGEKTTFRFLLRAGVLQPYALALAAVFLLAFSEFEIASLMTVKTWTVTVFDAHAGGLPVTQSVRLVVLPAVCELAVLLIIFALARARGEAVVADRGHKTAWLVLGVATLAILVVPAVIVLRGTVEGLKVIAQNFALSREIGASLLFGGCAGLIAYLAAGMLGPRALPFLVPGLMGTLVLSLLVLAALQNPILRHVRDTPVPLVVTLALWLVPWAVLLRWAQQRLQPSPAIHVARLLPKPEARRLVWELETRRQVGVVFLLCGWGYFDLTASAILAPIGVTPVMVRLYNLMHYGQTAVLSAMLGAAMFAPALVLALVWVTRTWWVRIRAHG